ncbi:MAG: DUF1272 domain-containing protein [Pseudomonadales bacterium]
MLEIRPNCEACDRDLPPDSDQARICTYECTFCADCVAQVLNNVCPNCGGGFAPRPIRPKNAHRSGVSLDHQPPSCNRVHTPYTQQELADFTARLSAIPPHSR